MTYSLFHLCNGNKTLVRAFEEFEAAKNHATHCSAILWHVKKTRTTQAPSIF